MARRTAAIRHLVRAPIQCSLKREPQPTLDTSLPINGSQKGIVNKFGACPSRRGCRPGTTGGTLFRQREIQAAQTGPGQPSDRGNGVIW
jgi:hypothetical protein